MDTVQWYFFQIHYENTSGCVGGVHFNIKPVLNVKTNYKYNYASMHKTTYIIKQLFLIKYIKIRTRDSTTFFNGAILFTFIFLWCGLPILFPAPENSNVVIVRIYTSWDTKRAVYLKLIPIKIYLPRITLYRIEFVVSLTRSITKH